jgi:hypothetical protein
MVHIHLTKVLQHFINVEIIPYLKCSFMLGMALRHWMFGTQRRRLAQIIE